jgi:hypothetical protein
MVKCLLYGHLESLLESWLWGGHWKGVQRKAIAAPHWSYLSSSQLLAKEGQCKHQLSETEVAIVLYICRLWHHVRSHSIFRGGGMWVFCQVGWLWLFSYCCCGVFFWINSCCKVELFSLKYRTTEVVCLLIIYLGPSMYDIFRTNVDHTWMMSDWYCCVYLMYLLARDMQV